MEKYVIVTKKFDIREGRFSFSWMQEMDQFLGQRCLVLDTDENHVPDDVLYLRYKTYQFYFKKSVTIPCYVELPNELFTM